MKFDNVLLFYIDTQFLGSLRDIIYETVRVDEDICEEDLIVSANNYKSELRTCDCYVSRKQRDKILQIIDILDVKYKYYRSHVHPYFSREKCKEIKKLGYDCDDIEGYGYMCEDNTIEVFFEVSNNEILNKKINKYLKNCNPKDSHLTVNMSNENSDMDFVNEQFI